MDRQRGQMRALGGRQQQPLVWRRALPLGMVALVFGGLNGYSMAVTDTVTEPEVAAVRRHMMDAHAVQRGLAWCCEARCVEAAALLVPLVVEQGGALSSA